MARAKLVRDGGSARLDDVEVIFSMAKKTNVTRHFGSRLVFAPDGTLFITTGDRGQRNRAQDMQDHAGSIIRINTDGSIPADNPSPDGAKHLPEIWSKGHRNAQGATWDPVLGGLLTVEHGDKGGDEVNHPQAGKNYGWPVISYGVSYSGKKIGRGTEAAGLRAAAVLLGSVDRAVRPRQLSGRHVPGMEGRPDRRLAEIRSSSRGSTGTQAGKILDEERMFEGEFGRIRDINVAPDGSIWLLTDEEDGQIIRLSRAD